MLLSIGKPCNLVGDLQVYDVSITVADPIVFPHSTIFSKLPCDQPFKYRRRRAGSANEFFQIHAGATALCHDEVEILLRP